MLSSVTRWLKKYFIPHEGNNHKPHFLRSETAIAIVGFVLFIEVAFLLQVLVVFTNTNFFASILPAVLVNETNSGRTVNNLQELNINPFLQEAAQLKADDMAAKSYFSHVSPDGKTPWQWLEEVGYDYIYAGENLAVDFIDSEDVVTAWMNSSAHRANILNNKFSEIGIAAARGTYEGRETTFIVQFFGRPALAALPPEEVIAQSEQPEEVVTQSEQIVPEPDVIPSVAEASPQVKGDVVELRPAATINGPSVSAKFFAKPRTVAGYLYYALLALTVLALILKIFIKIRVQHPQLIASGVFVISIIGLTLLVNEVVALFHAQIL